MSTSQHVSAEGLELESFSHPLYFHGQRLDVRHFEAEQDYFKHKLWLLNRLVSGYGVVCGLNVEPGEDRRSVTVASGLALDRLGREIVVPRRSRAVPIPALPAAPPDAEAPANVQADKGHGERDGQECDDEQDEWVHLAICFKACAGEPEPVLVGGCEPAERCAPGTVRERYELLPPLPGKARPVSLDCRIPDLVKNNRVNYAALAAWVSQPCACAPRDVCLPLANIRRPRGDHDLQAADIDISVRPVVYTLDLLFELILGALVDPPARRGGKY